MWDLKEKPMITLPMITIIMVLNKTSFHRHQISDATMKASPQHTHKELGENLFGSIQVL